MASRVRYHGLLVSFRRPAELGEHLRILTGQTASLDTLLVVDNDHDPAIRTLVEQDLGAAASVEYLGIDDNPGPAGAIAAGFAHILDRAADTDWIVLLDDDDPPPRHDTLAALREIIARLEATNDRVGGVGLWGARVRSTGRLRVDTTTDPAPVDYLPGGSCVHYRVEAVRTSDIHRPELFFGFDDLDLGLGLQRAGWNLYSSGLARAHGLAHMVEGRRTSVAVAPPSWRRYYSLRNLIVVLRRDGRTLAPLVMSLSAGLLKPLVNLPRRPRSSWHSIRANARALRDGWRGTVGKTVDPLEPPEWLR